MSGWAVVTGGARRLGRSFALELARSGYDVIIHAFRSEAEAAELAAEIRADYCRRAETVIADLSEMSGVEKVVRFTKERCEALSVLLNNASVWVNPGSLDGKKGIAQETVDNYTETMAVNLQAPFFLLQGLLPLLLKSAPGVVVNLLDGSVTDPYTTRASHSISKAGLLHLTALAAVSYRPSQLLTYGLELGAVLAPDGLAPGEEKGIAWTGAGPAVDALMRLLRERPQSGTVLRVG